MTRAAPGAPATDAAGRAAVALAIEAGRCLMAHFQTPIVARSKLDPGNVVTAADVESEQLIVAGLRERFPDHSIIAEESGVDLRASELTWIVDPLDGTSNFAAGIPWFGVLIAQLERGEPRLAVLHLPASDELYVAERGRGALRNGRPIAVARDAALRDVLWAYGIDTGGDDATQRARLAVLRALIASVRNVRTTNSLLDAAFTADGRLGGMLNVSTRLWDIAAPSLLVREAGGSYTNLDGTPLRFDLSAEAGEREYAVLAGAPALHAEVVALARDARMPWSN